MAKISPTQKIINQAGFIKTQMQDLVVKLEEHELFKDAENLESVLDEYSELIKGILHKNG